jgi:hypothetical protein
MLYQLSYASPTTPKNIAGNTGNPRAHSGSAHNTAQCLRLAHQQGWSKLAKEALRAAFSSPLLPHNLRREHAKRQQFLAISQNKNSLASHLRAVHYVVDSKIQFV